jgi:beta-phosphoglucomutase-like phosphatase (HAD superfamily)
MRKWLFLDFDNTQMGTEKLVLPSLVDRFNELYGPLIDRPLTLEDFNRHFHGQARETLCASMSKHFGIFVDYPTLFADREGRVMESYRRSGVEMAPGLLPALAILTAGGVLPVFVSNCPVQRGLAAMRYATNGKGDDLAACFGTRFFESGDKQKPLPDVYLRAMRQVDATFDDSAAVEDSVTGVKSAVAAGIPVFGYTGFMDDPQAGGRNLLDAGAIALFSDWADFPDLFRRMPGLS